MESSGPYLGTACTLHRGIVFDEFFDRSGTLAAEVEIDCFPSLIHGPVDVDPFALHLNISFRRTSRNRRHNGRIGSSASRTPGCMLPQRRMVVCAQANAALPHQGHEVAIVQFESEVPTNISLRSPGR